MTIHVDKTLLHGRRPPIGLALCVAAICWLLTAEELVAATITVTNTNDSGPGSLRQAIAAAAAGDTITFAAGLGGQTILLTAPLTLTKGLTLTGSTLATPITLSGNRVTRVLAVKPNIKVNIAGLVIADGRSARGGGLYNQGVTALDNVHFVRNRATSGGAIYTVQQLTIDNSTFTANRATEGAWWFSYGGAIDNQGDLQVSNSLFDENEAANGGAIGSSTAFTVTRSSFHQNRAIYGGAISAVGGTLLVQESAFISNQAHRMGGAIATNSDTVVQSSTFRANSASVGGAIRYFADIAVFNSTFSANKADYGSALTNGGAMRAFGELSIYNSTLVGNEGRGGPVEAHDGFQLYNSIIAHNTDVDCDIPPSANINNLIADGSCIAARRGSPRLGPLQPANALRQAYALLPDSPAIDAGDNTTCQATDQVGVLRPLDGNGDGVATCDIGAVERQPITASVEIYLQGQQQWIANGDNTPALADHTDFGQTIQPYASLTRTFTISNLGTIDLTDLRVTISGEQADAFQLIQPPSSTLMAASSSTFQIRFQSPALGPHQATVELQGNGNLNPLYTFAITGRDCRPALTVTTNADAGPGSLRQAIDDLCADGVITFGTALTGQTIALQQALLLQKNLTLDGATPATALTLSGSNEVRVFKVIRNVAVTLNRLIIANGRAPDGYGGGIYNQGVLTITNSTLMDNFAPLYSTDPRFAPYALGGGIYNNGQLRMNNSTLTNNEAALGGGAIYTTWSATDTLTITNSTLSGNRGSMGSAISGPSYLYNTIITADSNTKACSGAVATDGINLIEDGSCNAPLTGDPHLGPLLSYGYGILTHILLPGSPALDRGDNRVCPPTDQRGIARPQDGNRDGIAVCDLGAVEMLATTPIPTLPTVATPTHTPSHTPTPTPTVTPIPTLPPFPTDANHFDVRVYVAAPTTAIQVGETIRVMVTVDNRSVGCVYPVYELTLSQLGEAVFRFDSPATVNAPIGAQTIYTLTALMPGTVALQAVAYGERSCGDYWQWLYVNGSTYPVTVIAYVSPTPTATATPTAPLPPSPTTIATPTAPATPTPTNLPTLTPTLTPLPRTALPPPPGDGNGDGEIDTADVTACIHEIFDNDGNFWQDAPSGSYPATTGCDANRDTRIDAGDVSCTVLMVFNGLDHCENGTSQETGQAVASLTIASDRIALAGATVQVPISLTTNGSAVTAAAFRLHVDPARLNFDASDQDGDGLPDAVRFTLPPLSSHPLITATAHADTLDLFFTELAATPVAWYDGVFLTITLRVNPVVGSTPVMTTIAFDQSVLPSLGSATGASIPVQAEDGLVQLVPVDDRVRLYLPLVARR